ncbi:MAG: PTS sugar transporter subunit IIA [Sedimentisphaeraceae bacterium JB056]
MKLTDLVCPEAILIELNANERDDVIKELVISLGKAGKIAENDVESVIEAVISRENEASTGIGKGVAVPHVKTNKVAAPVAAFGLCPDGLDFSSLDKQPVYSIFLLISPDDAADAHISAMEVIFKNLQKDDFRSFLKQAKKVDDVVSLLKEADSDEI